MSLALNKFDPSNYTSKGLTLDEVTELREAFELFDSEKNGVINAEEFKAALKSLTIDVSNLTLSSMMSDIDKAKNSSIDFDTFVDIMTQKLSSTESKQDMEKVFTLFLGEENKNGKLTISHLRRVANELNENISDEELHDMIRRADIDNDNAVNFEDFYAIMTKKI
jgi:Ca2+-binding EF-hand superfamily protein